jgi:hypothetical protein
MATPQHGNNTANTEHGRGRGAGGGRRGGGGGGCGREDTGHQVGVLFVIGACAWASLGFGFGLRSSVTSVGRQVSRCHRRRWWWWGGGGLNLQCRTGFGIPRH